MKLRPRENTIGVKIRIGIEWDMIDKIEFNNWVKISNSREYNNYINNFTNVIEIGQTGLYEIKK